ncbi:hypothetical protein HYALB_00003269 [Hymenoscyphus albidus]|uniref:RRM domain-containing protein n=1 Tax=Hymenoscyphus albidus TaxID=595503 RepID=A0A9N9LGK0_9HELO|nr:hypothetical protein HYALB_00003269 [Hymenoscyphus albidus]
MQLKMQLNTELDPELTAGLDMNMLIIIQINMQSQASPRSSASSNRSYEATPESKLTAFSPEDRVTLSKLKSTTSKASSTPLKAGHHDPFVTAKPKLSATAMAFQPFAVPSGQPAASSSAARGSSSSMSPIHADYSQKQNLNVGENDHYGTFTTNTGASRCMKISSIYGADVENLVAASLKKLEVTKWKRLGTNRLTIMNNTVYIRESNIADAAHIYTALKVDNLETLEVSYIKPTAWAQVVSPGPSKPSDYEGEVILEAFYPVDRVVNQQEVEVSLRKLLATEGPLCAWRKLPSHQPGSYKLLAEFFDAAIATRAIGRILAMNKSKELPVSITAKQHNPELHTDTRPTATSTPTRQSTDRAHRLSDSLNALTIGRSPIDRSKAYSVRTADNYPSNTSVNRTPGAIDRSHAYAPTRTPGSVDRSNAYAPTRTPGSIDRSNAFANQPQAMTNGLAYFPASAAFAMAQGSVHGVPVMLGGLYNPSSPHAMQPQMMTPIHGSTPITGSLATMAPGMFATPPLYPYPGGDQSASPIAYPQQGLCYSPATPVNSRELGPFNRSSGRRQNAVKVPPHARRSHQNPAAGQHNHVDIARIRGGLDVRTTVMLRNIPNKVDQAMLKGIVDESSFGRYDFMYLRIDFSNNCNVGYAFINFVDPIDIITFVEARSNQKWHRFKSDKVAEVSYATIQGRDCLIQKFRNSSVMLEPAHYRPKLFFTLSDPFGRAGEEDVFPGSDNASKLKRSCENAEHVGLFAPSAGQHLRDEQRRRRSQYDRGTSLAEREEFDYEILDNFDNSQGFYQYHSY